MRRTRNLVFAHLKPAKLKRQMEIVACFHLNIWELRTTHVQNNQMSKHGVAPNQKLNFGQENHEGTANTMRTHVFIRPVRMVAHVRAIKINSRVSALQIGKAKHVQKKV